MSLHAERDGILLKVKGDRELPRITAGSARSERLTTDLVITIRIGSNIRFAAGGKASIRVIGNASHGTKRSMRFQRVCLLFGNTMGRKQSRSAPVLAAIISVGYLASATQLAPRIGASQASPNAFTRGLS